MVTSEKKKGADWLQRCRGDITFLQKITEQQCCSTTKFGIEVIQSEYRASIKDTNINTDTVTFKTADIGKGSML